MKVEHKSLKCRFLRLVGQLVNSARHRWSDEHGASIPEMLIAMVLAALAAGLIGTAVYQFFVVTNDGNKQLAVLHDIQNASVWLGRDVSESAFFTPGSGSVYGTFTAGDPTIEYRYSYDASDNTLVREYLQSSVVQSTLKIARRIADQSDVSFSVSGNLVTVSITATDTDGDVSESTTLKLAMRVN